MRFSYVTLRVDRLEESVKFLREVLGLEEVRRLKPREGMEIVFLEKAGVTGIELITKDGYRGNLESVSLTFEVENIEEAMAQFTAKGVESQTGLVSIGNGGQLIHYEDPSGIQIGLVFHPPGQFQRD